MCFPVKSFVSQDDLHTGGGHKCHSLPISSPEKSVPITDFPSREEAAVWGQAQTLNQLPGGETDMNEGSQREKARFLTSPHSTGLAGREFPPPALANIRFL